MIGVNEHTNSSDVNKDIKEPVIKRRYFDEVSDMIKSIVDNRNSEYFGFIIYEYNRNNT